MKKKKIQRSRVQKVTKTSLPAWLTGMQAVTWLVTNDEKLTIDANPGWLRKSHRPASSDEGIPPSAGDPADWGGVTLTWLRIKAGNSDDSVSEKTRNSDKVDSAIEALTRAAASGEVRAKKLARGYPAIAPEDWISFTLDEDDQNYCSLIMYPVMRPERPLTAKTIPLFDRAGVIALAISMRRKQRALRSPDALDKWLTEYASDFFKKHKRPPSRDKEAVPDSQKAGFGGVNKIRRSYARLPEHLRAAPRKPKRQRQCK